MFRSSTSLPAWVLLVALSAGCSDDETPLGPGAESTGSSPATVLETKPAPANGRIIYSAQVDGDLEIVSVNPDGTGFRRLTHSPGSDNEAAVSPDGRRIAFVSNRSGADQIYVMNADGSRQRQLTAFSLQDHAHNPTWSPDGRKIAFSAYVRGFDEEFEDRDIYVMSANGRNLRLLVGGLGEPHEDYEPVWSPDGTRLAFTRDAFNIFTANADGSNAQMFSQCGVHPCQSAAWSPDGARIAYEVHVSGGLGYFETKPLAGGAVQPFAVNLVAGRGGPAWAPDGTSLVYPGSDDALHFSLYTVAADGTGPRLIAPGSGSDQFPTWSPITR
jgi:TolB protein